MTDDSSVGSPPTDDVRPKRKVSYNQAAVICPSCNKRIRLNNDGLMRVHVASKMGSEQCVGSASTVPQAALDSLFSDPS